MSIRTKSAFLVAVTAGVLVTLPAATNAQMTRADSAAVIVGTADAFAEEGRWEIAEALYRLVMERYAATTSARTAAERLESPPEAIVFGDGTVELSVWMTLYGAWLGVAVPGAFGAESSEPYGVGLLVGGPTGFLTGRGIARSMQLTEGQARAITLGGTWGTWQGFGWREVFDWGVQEQCFSDGAGGQFCGDFEDSSEEAFAAMIVGGIAGIATGAALAKRDITPGTGTAVNAASLWGTWFGVAGGTLIDLEDDNLLAATLLGGNITMLIVGTQASKWNVSRGQARTVSIAGVLGLLAGLGIDLIVQPDSEKVAIGIPLATSVAGLALGVSATKDQASSAFESGPDGSLLRLQDGEWTVGLPLPVPSLAEIDGLDGPRIRPRLGFELFRASFF